MSSTNISLKKEAYEYLKSIKTAEESFSDAVLKLKKERTITGPILAQSLTHTPPNEKYFEERERSVSAFRKSFEQDFAR